MPKWFNTGVLCLLVLCTHCGYFENPFLATTAPVIAITTACAQTEPHSPLTVLKRSTGDFLASLSDASFRILSLFGPKRTTSSASPSFTEVEPQPLGEFISELRMISTLPPEKAGAKVHMKVRGKPLSCLSDKCAVEGINSKISSLTGLVNEAIKLIAVSSGVATANGKRLPRQLGETTEVELSEVPGLASSQAAVRRTSDLSDGAEVYDWTITGVEAESAKIMTVLATQAKKGEHFSGKLSGFLPNEEGWTAFSVVYRRHFGSLDYELKSVQIRGIEDVPQHFFKEDGSINFDVQRDRENRLVLASSLDSTGRGKTIFAWSPGKKDSKTRVFAVSTAPGPYGEDMGLALVGFKKDINEKNFAAGEFRRMSGKTLSALKMVRNNETGRFEGEALAQAPNTLEIETPAVQFP